MKKFIKKILYGGSPITEYTSITAKDISEKVLLKTENSVIDVSDHHWAFCLQPVIFGIWLKKSPDSALSSNNNFTLFIEEKTSGKRLAEIQASFFDRIEEEAGTLLLVKAGKCKPFHASFIETFLLYNYYYRKPGFSFNKFKSYISVFSYPRKVRIISFRKEGYHNIFPMDFVGQIGDSNFYVFGLRHTNHSLAEIISTKKLVVSDVPFTHKEDIYKLGVHHSSGPPLLEQLSFATFESKKFSFPVPEFAERYNEISITRTINLGSHMLLWGESQYEEIRKSSQGNLYHIHFLLHLFLKRQGISYTQC